MSTQKWKFYAEDGDSLKKQKKECPRCGPAIFLADHKDRFACGACGYTEFKKGE